MREGLLLLLLAMGALAEVPRVCVIGQTDEVVSGPLVPMFHITSGQSLRLDISVEAPVGSSIDLKASASYLTQGHQAPLPKVFPLKEQIQFLEGTRQVVAVEIPMPRLTDGPVVLRYDLHTDPPGNMDTPPHFHVRLIPLAEQTALTLSFTAALKKSGRRLALYGESPRLRHLFETYGIAFKDLGTLRPDTLPREGLTVSEDAPPPHGEPIHGRLVLFHQSPQRPLPGIYQQAGLEGRVTLVTLPVWTDQPPSLLIEILCEELL